MDPTEKINLLISQFTNQDFTDLETTLSTPSEPYNVDWDTEITTGEHKGKAVLDVAIAQWERQHGNTIPITLSPIATNTRRRFIAEGSPNALNLLRAFYRLGVFNPRIEDELVFHRVTRYLNELVDANISSLSQPAINYWLEPQAALSNYFSDMTYENAVKLKSYCLRAQKIRLTCLPNSELFTTFLKIISLKGNSRVSSDTVTRYTIPALIYSMDLSPAKWSIMLSQAAAQYEGNSYHFNSSDLSLNCAKAIQNNATVSASTFYPSLEELKRQFTQIITYRFRCYINQYTNTPVLLPQFFAPSEKKFYTDYLQAILCFITRALHLIYVGQSECSEPNLSWLTSIINTCLDTPYSDSNQHSLREMINALKINAADKLAAELTYLTCENNYTIYLATDISQIITRALCIQSTAAFESIDVSLLSKALAHNKLDLTEIYMILKDNKNQKISLLNEEQEEKLLGQAKNEFIASGLEASFEILCQFYDENLALADVKGVVAENNDTASKEENKATFRELVYLYRTNHTLENNDATKFFKKLLDRNIMTFNSRFQFGHHSTLFHVAMCAGYIDIVDFLIQEDANPNWLDGKHFTPIQSALIKLNDPKSTFIKTANEDQHKNILLCLEKLANYYKLDWGKTSDHPPLLVFALENNCHSTVFSILINSPYFSPAVEIKNLGVTRNAHIFHVLTTMILDTNNADSNPGLNNPIVANLVNITRLLLAQPKTTHCDNTALFLNFFESFSRLCLEGKSTGISHFLHKTFCVALQLIELCDENANNHDKIQMQTVFNENFYPNFCKSVFVNHLAATNPRLFGVILTKVKALNIPALENWMALDANKWSHALSHAGKYYIQNLSSTHSALSKNCAIDLRIDLAQKSSHSIELSKLTPPHTSPVPTHLKTLHQQLHTVLRYRLRCYLENISEDKRFYSQHLSSLLPFITAFMRDQMRNPEPTLEQDPWLRTLLSDCLSEVVSETDSRPLGQALSDLSLGSQIREKLGQEFGVEIESLYTQALQTITPPAPNIIEEDYQENGEYHSKTVKELSISMKAK